MPSAPNLSDSGDASRKGAEALGDEFHLLEWRGVFVSNDWRGGWLRVGLLAGGRAWFCICGLNYGGGNRMLGSIHLLEHRAE